MKMPNGYGSVVKLTGRRRRPWMVRITTGVVMDMDTMKAKQIRQVLGYYASRTEALQALADYNDDPYNLESARYTFRYCYEQASKDFSAARAHNYRSGARYLEPIMDLPIRSVKAIQMQDCIDACKTTQQREVRTVCKKVFEYALQHDIVDKNPALYVHANSVPATIDRGIFTPWQVADLFECSDLWYARVALILLYTGMRTKELRDLTDADIDLDKKIIHIRKAKNKSSIRDIPIHDQILPILTAYKQDPVIKSHNALNKNLQKHYGRLAHDCRHTFTTRMRECGCDLLVLQLLLGHAPQTITERIYTHVSMADLRKAINGLNYGAQG